MFTQSDAERDPVDPRNACSGWTTRARWCRRSRSRSRSSIRSNWEIKIRPGLTFHNGEPINADAVVFTFDRAKKLFAAGQGRPHLRARARSNTTRMEKIDD